MEIKESRCAFVVIKVKVRDEPYFLMRQDPDWKDVNFIGGHAASVDKGKFERTARRELLEEVPGFRRFKSFELKPLSTEVTYGPVLSKSAKQPVKYVLRFFFLKFTIDPGELFGGLTSPRSLNVLVKECDLISGQRIHISKLADVLRNALPNDLLSIPFSWPDNLESPFLISLRQRELSF